MERKNSLGRSINQNKRDYDESCKRILAEKQVRARILKDYVREFADLEVAEIEALLTEDVDIGTEPLDRDERVGFEQGSTVELGTEDKTVDEGTARFDVRFRVPVPSGEGSLAVEVDLEAQNRWSTGYPLPSRAVFYCARMISAQGNRVLPHSEYGRLRKVCSLWVCSHPDAEHRGVVEHFSIRPHTKAGEQLFCGYDLMHICFVCLDKEKVTSAYGCLGLLGALFARESDAAKLRDALANDFGMILTEEIDERIESMCNLSEGIWEDGKAEGVAEGRAEGVASSLANLMRTLSVPIERAMELLGIPAEERGKYESLVADLQA